MDEISLPPMMIETNVKAKYVRATRMPARNPEPRLCLRMCKSAA